MNGDQQGGSQTFICVKFISHRSGFVASASVEELASLTRLAETRQLSIARTNTYSARSYAACITMNQCYVNRSEGRSGTFVYVGLCSDKLLMLPVACSTVGKEIDQITNKVALQTLIIQSFGRGTAFVLAA